VLLGRGLDFARGDTGAPGASIAFGPNAGFLRTPVLLVGSKTGHPSTIWDEDPQAFIARHGMSVRQAMLLRSTAEHLLPRSEGGGNSVANVVAACRYATQRDTGLDLLS